MLLPRPAKQTVAQSPGASFAKRGSRRRSLGARVPEPVFVLFKNRFLTELSLSTPGEQGKWQQGIRVECENKRMTEYNLPCKLAAGEGKVRGGGQAGGEGNCSPALHATPSGPSLPGPAPSWPPCPGAGRSLPPYRTLPGRASSGAGPPPWPPRGRRRVSSVRFSAEVTRAEM